eukprot:3287741-Rhodomonas_salina.2
MLQVRFAPRALRGTDKAAFRTQRGQTVITTGQTVHSSDEHEHDGTVSAYALPMRCPVLTARIWSGVTHSDTMVGSVNVWTIKGIHASASAMRCPVLTSRGVPGDLLGTFGLPDSVWGVQVGAALVYYAIATRCPVLT